MHRVNKSDLLLLARTLHQEVPWSVITDPAVVAQRAAEGKSFVDALKDWANRRGIKQDQEDSFGNLVTWFALGSWHQDGLPQVGLGHKQVAALASAVITPDAADLVKMPWGTFFISIPVGLFQFREQGEVEDVFGLLACNLGPHLPDKQDAIMLHAVSSRDCTLLPGRTMRQLIEGAKVLKPDLREGSEPLPERERRVTNLLMRLFVMTCMAMTNREEFVDRPPKQSRSEKKREADLPSVHQFLWRKEIEVDCRPFITDYLDGVRRGELRVQTMTCGHFKRQVCGVGRQDRKVIWVDPYWRGMEDAPITVTPKQLRNVPGEAEVVGTDPAG